MDYKSKYLKYKKKYFDLKLIGNGKKEDNIRNAIIKGNIEELKNLSLDEINTLKVKLNKYSTKDPISLLLFAIKKGNKYNNIIDFLIKIKNIDLSILSNIQIIDQLLENIIINDNYINILLNNKTFTNEKDLIYILFSEYPNKIEDLEIMKGLENKYKSNNEKYNFTEYYNSFIKFIKSFKTYVNYHDNENYFNSILSYYKITFNEYSKKININEVSEALFYILNDTIYNKETKSRELNSNFIVFNMIVDIFPDSINQKDEYGLTPLWYVCLYRKEKEFNKIINHPNLNREFIIESNSKNLGSPYYIAKNFVVEDKEKFLSKIESKLFNNNLQKQLEINKIVKEENNLDVINVFYNIIVNGIKLWYFSKGADKSAYKIDKYKNDIFLVTDQKKFKIEEFLINNIGEYSNYIILPKKIIKKLEFTILILDKADELVDLYLSESSLSEYRNNFSEDNVNNLNKLIETVNKIHSFELCRLDIKINNMMIDDGVIKLIDIDRALIGESCNKKSREKDRDGNQFINWRKGSTDFMFGNDNYTLKQHDLHSLYKVFLNLLSKEVELKDFMRNNIIKDINRIREKVNSNQNNSLLKSYILLILQKMEELYNKASKNEY
jgi:hypothetical protein